MLLHWTWFGSIGEIAHARMHARTSHRVGFQRLMTPARTRGGPLGTARNLGQFVVGQFARFVLMVVVVLDDDVILQHG